MWIWQESSLKLVQLNFYYSVCLYVKSHVKWDFVCFPSGDHHAKKNNRPTPKIALVLTIRRKWKLKKTCFNLSLVILNLKVPSGFRPSQPHTKRANFTFNITAVRKPFFYYLVLSFVARDLPWYSLDSLFTRDFLWVIHQSKHSWKYYVMLRPGSNWTANAIDLLWAILAPNEL